MVEKEQGFSKTCYYEVLGVDRKAEKKEIDRAYKKSALKWHPDKNKDTDTTEKFQEIQEAYQCLSNDQERAWYDAHRDQILRGKTDDDYSEADCSYTTTSKLKPYFSTSVFTGYSTSKKDNFYEVFGELFKRLDKEEEMEEQVGTNHRDAPPFGGPDATMEEVYAFYKHWDGFATLKQFAYADVYNPKEAPNRRVKRLIENENKKARQKEKNRFNDTMRDLINHVKKLDDRLQKYLLQEAKVKEQKRREEEQRKEEKRLAEAERLRIYREERAAYYAKQEEQALENGEFDEVLVEEFRCQICKKSFKKDKQLDNHLRSKKHKDAEAKYKSMFQLDEESEQQIAEEAEKQRLLAEEEAQIKRLEEEQALRDDEQQYSKKKRKNQTKDDEEIKETTPEAVDPESTENIQDFVWKANKKDKKKKNEKNKAEKKVQEQIDAINKKNKEAKLKEMEKQKNKKNKKANNQQDFDQLQQKQQEPPKMTKAEAKQEKKKKKFQERAEELSQEEEEEEEDDEQQKDQEETKEQESKSDKKSDVQEEEEQESEEEETKEGTSVTKEPASNTEEQDGIDDDNKEDEEEKKEEQQAKADHEDEDEEEVKQMSKKDKRRAKKAAKQEQEAKNKAWEKENGPMLKCNVCSAKFETRNKLMKHVNATGHALRK